MVAVVGAGYWGKNLVRNFYSIGHLGCICDGNELLKAGYADQYPQTEFFTDYDEMLRNDGIQAVALASPAISHYEMAKQALLNGKHVFVEKPLALATKDAEHLIELTRQQKKVLMVGHILQYHPAVIKLKALVTNGELGKLRYLYSNRLNMGKIRTEENILWSFAPHDISVILMLLDEMPDRLFTNGGNYLQEKIADATVTILNFPSGVKAHIFVSWLHPFKEQKLVVVGDKKMAVFDDTVENKLVLFPHKVEWQNRLPVAAKAEGEVVDLEMGEPLKAECQHFIDCILQHKTPRSDGNEGLRVLKVLTASQESLDQQGKMIHITKAPHVDAKPSTSNFAVGTIVHESAYIDDGVQLGSGTRIWHFSHVLKGSKIGENCRIGQNVVIGPNASIGRGCKIQNNVSIYEGVTLEDYVFCGPSMVFTNVFNPRCEIPRMGELRPTLIKKGASLGANCTIVCGHMIGKYAFVGAGAVVTRDIPAHALMVGNPAEISGWMCRCGFKLDQKNDRLECRACGNRYQLKGEVLEKNMSLLIA